MVKPDGPPQLCKTDEVGELCVASGTVGSAYFGLVGKTNHTFKVIQLMVYNMKLINNVSFALNFSLHFITLTRTKDSCSCVFKVQPLGADGGPVEQYSHYSEYVRTGLLGFLGPVRITL